MAGPQFPRERGVLSPDVGTPTCYFAFYFCQKLYENFFKKWTERGQPYTGPTTAEGLTC